MVIPCLVTAAWGVGGRMLDDIPRHRREEDTAAVRLPVRSTRSDWPAGMARNRCFRTKTRNTYRRRRLSSPTPESTPRRLIPHLLHLQPLLAYSHSHQTRLNNANARSWPHDAPTISDAGPEAEPASPPLARFSWPISPFRRASSEAEMGSSFVGALVQAI